MTAAALTQAVAHDPVAVAAFAIACGHVALAVCWPRVKARRGRRQRAMDDAAFIRRLQHLTSRADVIAARLRDEKSGAACPWMAAP